MHITIVAIGSRGDVQPYIALGQGLQQAKIWQVFTFRRNISAMRMGQGLRVAR